MPAPYPHDLWPRLTRLDRCCVVAVYSSREASDPPDGPARFWVASARRRDDESRVIECKGVSLVEAVSRLLVAVEAERFVG